MNSIFLRAKHWQLFVPLIVIPFVTMIIFGIIMAFTLISNPPERPEDAIWLIYSLPFISIICGFVQFAWFWNVLTKLKMLVNSTVRFPVVRIKLFFFIPILYFCVLPFFIAFAVKTTNSNNQFEGSVQLAVFGILIFLLHFFSIFCILHTIYFSAKIIRCAELQRNARFSTFVGYFFLIWIFPVGIWFIQPKINALITQAERPGSNSGDGDLIDRF